MKVDDEVLMTWRRLSLLLMLCPTTLKIIERIERVSRDKHSDKSVKPEVNGGNQGTVRK